MNPGRQEFHVKKYWMSWYVTHGKRSTIFNITRDITAEFAQQSVHMELKLLKSIDNYDLQINGILTPAIVVFKKLLTIPGINY